MQPHHLLEASSRVLEKRGLGGLRGRSQRGLGDRAGEGRNRVTPVQPCTYPTYENRIIIISDGFYLYAVP